jgi:prepilin-type N-terminal cleavage/methylation domain-containing protein
MKPRSSNQANHALTLIEVLVVIAVLAVVAALLLPALLSHHEGRMQLINCVNNLKEIGVAYRVWEGDNGDKYPMFVSVTNGGAMELIATGNVTACFLVMSNELSMPKILACPDDKKRLPAATSFSDPQLTGKISYFVNLDATENCPQMLLSGDDNFEIGGVPVKSGLVQFSTNAYVAWTSGRHVSYNSHFWIPVRNRFMGNIGLADGSVQQVTTDGLLQLIRQTGTATNRLAIP